MGSKERTKVIKAEGAWAPRLWMGPLQSVQGFEDWVVGSRCCRPRPRRTLEPGQPRAVTSRKSCLLPPWLFCPGDGMGCAGSSSRSGAAWLAGGPEALLPCQPAACCLLAFPWVPLGNLLQHNYADNYSMRRYLQRQKRAQHTNACLQCSFRRAWLGGDVLYMYVCTRSVLRAQIMLTRKWKSKSTPRRANNIVSLLPAV